MKLLFRIAVCSVLGLYAIQLQAALIVNPPMPITAQVFINPVIASNSDGSNMAEFMGTPIQQAEIMGMVNTIWAQAGIEVIWQPPDFWDDDFANIGTPGMNNPRPNSDLGQVVADAGMAGFLDPNPNVINMFFVEIAAGFSNVSENTVNGLAFVGGNGITQHVGDNLPGFLLGREAVASVIAHEIGHNLGLFHIVEAENLMQAGGSPNQGERLNAAQIAIALNSQFVQAIPEPGSGLLLVGMVFVGLRRRHRALQTR